MQKRIDREKVSWDSFITQEDKETTTKETKCERD